jgi:hypothetical protein
MRRRLASTLILVATLSLAACNRQDKAPNAPAAKPAAVRPAAPAQPPAAPVAQGFRHAAGLDLFGYYFPQSDVMFGNFKLRQLNLGSAEEFEAYEKGQRISPNYAPVMLEFDDITSPQKENELGQTYHEVSRRVLPDAYEVTAATIRFHGHDEVLGDVAFEGRIDAAALARVRAGGAEEPVLTGVVTAMRQRLNRVFVWFGGD